MKDKTISAHYVQALLASLSRKGISKEQALIGANILLEDIEPPTNRVAYDIVVSLSRFAWKTLNDESLGLSPKPMKIGAFNFAGQISISAKSLGVALEELVNFYNFLDPGYHLSINTQDNETELVLQLDDPEYDQHHLLVDFVMHGIHSFLCWLTDKNIILKEANFPFPPPPHEAEYALVYHCPKHFNASKSSIVFSRDNLKLEVVKNRHDLKKYVASTPKNFINIIEQDNSYSARVRKVIEAHEGHDYPNFEYVAEQLFMVPKTLRQRLKNEGITYQKIKDVMRRDLAIYYLYQPHYSIANIAEKVGFTETGAFIRAFKSWTDMTPGVYRAKYVVGLNSFL